MVINYLTLGYLAPILSVILLLIKKFDEPNIRRVNFVSVTVPFICTCLLIAHYCLDIRQPIGIDLFDVSVGHGHKFSFSMYIDELSLIILFLTGSLSILVGKFSHTYLHKETGYQRFFKTISLLVFGLQVVALAGSLDLFFAGWEIIGFASFLLIAFYRDRTRPVKNAFRVFSVYRVCDIGLLMGAILTHVLWKSANKFDVLLSSNTQMISVDNHFWLIIISSLLLFAAIGKSGQFPFLNWPARAMEGPTPSSAIFYGGLSIHCGVFLLYRTYNIWSQSGIMVFLVGLIGFLSMTIATGIGRVQSNIKGQFAYASIAQIGIMFIELALGLKLLVLVHLTCHCFLRCYQILMSPSSVVKHVKTMDMDDAISLKKSIEDRLPLKLRTTLFSFGLQEGFLSISERGFFILPAVKMKLFARKYLTKVGFFFILLAFMIFIAIAQGHYALNQILAYAVGAADLSISLYCLISLENPNKIWNYFLLALVLFFVASYLFDPACLTGIYIYMLSAIPCWVIGKFALRHFAHIDMKKYNGFHVIDPKRTTFFFIAFVGLSGLPFTTTFWGEDIIFSELITAAPALLALAGISLMLNGLIVARILTKVFWGFPSHLRY